MREAGWTEFTRRSQAVQKEAQSQEIGLSRNLNKFRIVGAKGSQFKGGGGPECKMIIRQKPQSEIGVLSSGQAETDRSRFN